MKNYLSSSQCSR